ncbi:MAG: Periplasmic chaperone and peptidyl-prolyl cis-trans isomerase of outer membrane proteins SurA, partial [uncultured Gemmatimonadaceae bacterium]
APIDAKRREVHLDRGRCLLRRRLPAARHLRAARRRRRRDHQRHHRRLGERPRHPVRDVRQRHPDARAAGGAAARPRAQPRRAPPDRLGGLRADRLRHPAPAGDPPARHHRDRRGDRAGGAVQPPAAAPRERRAPDRGPLRPGEVPPLPAEPLRPPDRAPGAARAVLPLRDPAPEAVHAGRLRRLRHRPAPLADLPRRPRLGAGLRRGLPPRAHPRLGRRGERAGGARLLREEPRQLRPPGPRRDLGHRRPAHDHGGRQRRHPHARRRDPSGASRGRQVRGRRQARVGRLGVGGQRWLARHELRPRAGLREAVRGRRVRAPARTALRAGAHPVRLPPHPRGQPAGRHPRPAAHPPPDRAERLERHGHRPPRRPAHPARRRRRGSGPLRRRGQAARAPRAPRRGVRRRPALHRQPLRAERRRVGVRRRGGGRRERALRLARRLLPRAARFAHPGRPVAARGGLARDPHLPRQAEEARPARPAGRPARRPREGRHARGRGAGRRPAGSEDRALHPRQRGAAARPVQPGDRRRLRPPGRGGERAGPHRRRRLRDAGRPPRREQPPGVRSPEGRAAPPDHAGAAQRARPRLPRGSAQVGRPRRQPAEGLRRLAPAGRL